MRILGSRRRVSLVGVLCGLFLLTGVLQADVTTTWTIHNAYLYYDGSPIPFEVTGSFTFDSTLGPNGTITSINMQVPYSPLTFHHHRLCWEAMQPDWLPIAMAEQHAASP